MNLATLEQRFGAYLDRSWRLSDIAPFLRVYIRLLIPFKGELSQAELNVVLERQKQLHGEEFTDAGFEEQRKLSRERIDRDLRGGGSSSARRAAVDRLLFCTLLDTAETDFFYLTEPMFEFARRMEVPPDELKQLLESEFVGFE
jgi:hypothetical protein